MMLLPLRDPVGVRIRRRRVAAEQPREGVVERSRRGHTREGTHGLVPRQDVHGVRGVAADAADLDEKRSPAAGVHLLGANVIQRPSGRLGRRLRADARWIGRVEAAVGVRGHRVAREERALDLRVGIVLLTMRAAVAPLVHGPEAANHQQLVRVRRHRLERVHGHVVGRGQRAMRQLREPPGRQAAVVRIEDDQPLRGGCGHPLGFRLTLGD